MVSGAAAQDPGGRYDLARDLRRLLPGGAKLGLDLLCRWRQVAREPDVPQDHHGQMQGDVALRTLPLPEEARLKLRQTR